MKLMSKSEQKHYLVKELKNLIKEINHCQELIAAEMSINYEDILNPLEKESLERKFKTIELRIKLQ